MKRLAWLLLIVILSLNTLGFTLPASPPAPGSSIPSNPPNLPETAFDAGFIPGHNLVCHNIGQRRVCASVSEARVLPGSVLTVYGMLRLRGEGVPGVIMNVIWAGRITETCVGVTDSSGVASCNTFVPSYMKQGYRVTVKVLLDHYKVSTNFRTRDTSHANEKKEED